MRLSLGTAQFGLDYGITNAAGQVAHSVVPTILKTAQSHGICNIDTAAAYGTAETVLEGCGSALEGFRVTSKIPSLAQHSGKAAIEALVGHVTTSHQRLGARLETVLFHDASDILRPEGLSLWAALEDVAARLSIKALGVSVYDAREIRLVLDTVSPNVIQLPFNLFDQRLADDGSLDLLVSHGCQIEARSVFLQGLILSGPKHIPYHLRGLRPAAQRLQDEAAGSGRSLLEIALAFLRLKGCINGVVVGVTSAEELDAICLAKNAEIPSLSYSNFSVCDASLVDPRHWEALKQEKRAS